MKRFLFQVTSCQWKAPGLSPASCSTRLQKGCSFTSTYAVLQWMRGQEGPPPAIDVAERLPLAETEYSAMVIIRCAIITRVRRQCCVCTPMHRWRLSLKACEADRVSPCVRQYLRGNLEELSLAPARCFSGRWPYDGQVTHFKDSPLLPFASQPLPITEVPLRPTRHASARVF